MSALDHRRIAKIIYRNSKGPPDPSPAVRGLLLRGLGLRDWMGPMTMEYPMKPDSELTKLQVGDHIEAVVVVQGEKYYVTDVKVVSKQ